MRPPDRFDVVPTPRSNFAGRRRALLGALLLLGALGVLRPPPAPATGEATILPGESRERGLRAGEGHDYRVELPAGVPALLAVEQRGIDVEIEVTPAGGERFVADGPFDRRGRETLLLEGSPSYRVTLRGREAGAPPGTYALRLEPLPPDTPSRSRRLAAAREVTAAARLYPEGTVEAWRRALDRLGAALGHWRAAGEEAEAARALYARAVLHRLVDEPREATEAAREASTRFRRLGDGLQEAYASNELGLDHWHLGDLDAARGAFERSSALGRAAADPFVVAAAASNLCLLDLSRGDLQAGRACYQVALPAIERAGAVQIESAARTNLGRLAEHLGEPEEALEHYRRALDLQAVGGDRRSQAQTLNNLGVLLRGRGDLDAAMARYAEALEIFDELGERRWQARVLSNVGFAYRSLHERRRARVSFERSLDLFRQVEDRRGQAATLDNLGIVEREEGRPAEALELHLRALELRRVDGDRRGEAVTLRRLGEAHAELGERDAARGRFSEAVAISAELGDVPSAAAAHRGLGEAHLAEGNPGAARRELEAALALFGEAGQRGSEAEVLYHLARVERAANRLEAARGRLAGALARLEDVRARIDSPDLRTSYSSLLRGVHELDVDLLMTAHRADPGAGHDRRALEVAESSRARALLELLQEANVDLTTGVSPALLDRRRGLSRRLNAKTERLLDPKLDPGSRTRLEAEQLALLQRLEVLDAEIRRESPAYGEIVRPRPITAEEIQSLVDPATTLAVYFLGEPASRLWRVTPAAVEVLELPGRATIEAAARRVHELWSDLDVASRARDHAAAEELAAMLRLPELLGDASPEGTLAVVADGALHLVPFAALPVPGGAPGTPPVPLVDRTRVVFLPSAAVLALDRRHHGGPAVRASVAILADPLFGPDHPPLPGSRIEAAAIAATASPASILTALGADANRDLVESGRLEGYGVVHFATHGSIDTANPALSGLVLSQIDADDRPRPGFLHLRDVYNLHLDADLVVLSGCRTALGPVVRGEGVIGLARGFMYAGSRRVMASLWQVEDRATAALMGRFYRALWQDGLPPAAALAKAQRELSDTRRFRDPYHWAGFVLVGDWR